MYQRHIKRLMDVVFSICALLILSPVFLLLALWIKLDSKGPVFFHQKRVGIHKTHFIIWKFRTMRIDAPEGVATHLLENPHQYITRCGKFLRKKSLDELPQFINVLKGDMSIVGPRPALWNQHDLVELRDQEGANDVLPGIAGLAQIQGRDTLSLEDKAKYDGVYARNISLWLDIKCVLKATVNIGNGEGVVEGTQSVRHEAEKSK